MQAIRNDKNTFYDNSAFLKRFKQRNWIHNFVAITLRTRLTQKKSSLIKTN